MPARTPDSTQNQPQTARRQTTKVEQVRSSQVVLLEKWGDPLHGILAAGEARSMQCARVACLSGTRSRVRHRNRISALREQPVIGGARQTCRLCGPRDSPQADESIPRTERRLIRLTGHARYSLRRNETFTPSSCQQSTYTAITRVSGIGKPDGPPLCERNQG